MRSRARLPKCGGGSGSEQNQLVQEEMCVTEQVERMVEVEENGDTHVEVCRVSRCCSRSEVVAMDSNLRPLSQKSIEDELMMEEREERPLSTVSSSSHVLQSLKEDQDDDLPPSASQCCHRNEPSPTFETHPTSNISVGSAHREERGSRAVSAASSCHCGAATPHSTAEAEEMDETPSSKPRISRASCKSSKANIPASEEEGAADDEDKEIKRVVSGLSGHTGLLEGSLQSRASSVCPQCGGCKPGVTSVSNSRTSQRSHHSQQASPKPVTLLSNQENANNSSDDDGGSNVSAVSTQSNKTNLTNHGCFSAISNVQEGRASNVMSTTSNPEETTKEEKRAPSATSATSHRSHKSGCNGSTGLTAEKEEGRSPSAMSAQSSKSHKSNCSGTAEASDTRTREEAEGAVERTLSSLSAKSGASKTNASVMLSVMVASPTDNTTVEEDATDKRTASALSGKSNVSDKPGKAERPDSVVSAKSTKSNVSVKSSTSHRSTCSHCARAVSAGADEPVVEATQQEERSLSPRSETGGEKTVMSQMSGRAVKCNTSVKSSKSCKSNYNGDETAASPSLREAEEKESEMVEEETQERAESVMSAKLENEERVASAGSCKSHKSNCNENPGASSEIGDNIGDGEEVQERAASALSRKSASSAKSHHSNCDAGSRVASPAKDKAKTEVNSMEDRTPSAMSGKSNSSAKSSKSQKSNRTAASLNPNEADGSSIEANEDEKQTQERVASAMSVKSKSSVRSSTSHKSNSNKNVQSVSPNANVVTIQTPERVDEEGNDTTERALSSASAKSGKSNVSSALLHKSSHNGVADIAVVETTDADEDNRPISKSSHGQTLSPRRIGSPQTHSPKAPATPPSSPKSSVQQLLPGVGNTRGPSALSVRSTKSAKSGRSKCHCGAASAKKEQEDENKEVKSEEASERAASILSSSTKRTRRESGGTEQALSRNSSGSVSLGLPEDTADSDSGKSSFSFHVNTERVKTGTPDVPKSTEESALKEDVEGRGSTTSQKSHNNASKSTLPHNTPAVNIPTIETPGGSYDKGEESGEQNTVRAAGAFSAKSNSSHEPSCNCNVKAASQTLETGSVKSASRTKASNMNAPNNRTSSALSSASAKVRSESPASASIKNANAAKTTAGDSANNDTENQAVTRPASEAKDKEDITDNKAASVHSKSPCFLRPELAASALSDSLNPVKCPRAKSSGSVKTQIKSSSPCPLPSSRPGSKVETCNDSTLSHSLSAADLLKENMAAAHPHSRHSQASKTSYKKGGRSRNQTHQEELELTPACLPNASPNEVVSDWLRSIPADSSMLALGDELHEEKEEEKAVEANPGEGAAKEEESPEDKRVDKEEKAEAEEEGEKEEEVEGDAVENKSSDPAPGDAVGISYPKTLLLSGEPLSRNCHSSAAVMKVLLSSSLGRCQSLPEVSQ